MVLVLKDRMQTGFQMSTVTHYLCQFVLKDVITDSRNLKSITIHGKEIKLQFIICADLKFTNVVLGLGPCSAGFSCAWCKSKSCNLYDVNLAVSACTTEEIQQLCQKKKSKRQENYNCIKPPIFTHIPISHIIPDPLHLYLRISDQLIRQLVLFIRTADNISKKQKNVDKSKCMLVLKFKNFVQGLCIDWQFSLTSMEYSSTIRLSGHNIKRFRRT